MDFQLFQLGLYHLLVEGVLVKNLLTKWSDCMDLHWYNYGLHQPPATSKKFIASIRLRVKHVYELVLFTVAFTRQYIPHGLSSILYLHQMWTLVPMKLIWHHFRTYVHYITKKTRLSWITVELIKCKNLCPNLYVETICFNYCLLFDCR